MLRQLTFAVTLLAQTACVDAKPVWRQNPEIDGQVAKSGDWLAGCDNVGRCTAIGVPRAQAKAGLLAEMPYDMGIIYTIKAGVSSIETVEIFPSNDVIIDGLELFRIAGLPTDMGRNFRFLFDRVTLPPESAFELAKMLKAGEAVRGVNDNNDNTRVRFPGAGFAAVAEAIDRHLDTFVMPSGAVDDLPLNKLRPIAVTRGKGHGELTAIRDELPCDPARTGATPRKYIMFGGRLLLRLQCDQLSRNAISYWYEVDRKAKYPTLLALPEPREDILAKTSKGLSDASLDPEKGILQSTEFSGPDGDCGVTRRWATTSAGWLLLDRREMPRCGSTLKPADWIRTYRSPVNDEESVL